MLKHIATIALCLFAISVHVADAAIQADKVQLKIDKAATKGSEVKPLSL
jgi:hypothetical protein